MTEDQIKEALDELESLVANGKIGPHLLFTSMNQLLQAARYAGQGEAFKALKCLLAVSDENPHIPIGQALDSISSPVRDIVDTYNCPPAPAVPEGAGLDLNEMIALRDKLENAHLSAFMAGEKRGTVSEDEDRRMLHATLVLAANFVDGLLTAAQGAGAPAPAAPAPGATHRCSVCGAHWVRNDAESWSLASANCGPCCDNARMGDQIVPLTNTGREESK